MSRTPDPARHARISALFEDLADLPEAERAMRLEIACSGDDDLRLEVEALLTADAAPAPVDAPPPLDDLALPPVPGGPADGTASAARTRQSRRGVRVAAVLALVTVATVVGALIGVSAARREAAAQLARADALTSYVRAVLGAAPPLDGASDDPTVGDLLAVAEADLARDLGDHPVLLAQMEAAIGAAHRARGDFAAADRLLAAAVEHGGDIDAPGHDAALRARVELGRLRVDQGRAAAAVELVRPALEQLRAAQGPDAIRTLDAANLLGWALYNDGQIAEARDVLTDTLDRRDRTLGSDHADALLTRTNLSLVQRAHREFDAALALASEAVAGYTRTLGPRHPTTLYARHVESRAMGTLRRFDEAAMREAEVVADAVDVLGPAHPYTLFWRTTLASDLRRIGDLEGAEFHVQQVVDARRTLIGGGQGSLVGSLLELATVQRQRDRVAEAEASGREALRIASALSPPQRRLEWWSRLAIGLAVASQDGRRVEGAELLRALDATMVKEGATANELRSMRDLVAPLLQP